MKNFQTNVLHITEIIRHGSRAPFDVFKDVDWIKEYQSGDLTNNGVRMHFVAGQEIRKRYPTIFNSPLNSEEIYVRSTAYNRTIQSAMVHLYGIFYNDTSKKIDFDANDQKVLPPFNPKPKVDVDFKTALPVNYIPLPVHSAEDKNNDLFLGADTKICNKTWNSHFAAFYKIQDKLIKLQSFKNPILEAIEKLQLNVEESKIQNFDLNLAYYISDFVISDYYNNPKPILDISKPDMLALYKKLERIYTVVLYSYYADEKYRKVFISNFMREILRQITFVSELYRLKRIDTMTHNKFT